MKALILNSGIGSRMGIESLEHPKCMTKILYNETILSRQLKQLVESGIKEVVMTTGPFESELIKYCNSLKLPLHISFINNPIYDKTNYIYSIYCARKEIHDDIILLHGDLVFEQVVLDELLESENSCVVVSASSTLPEKDFKAVIKNEKVVRIGIDCFENAISSQPLYKLNYNDWEYWLNKIGEFCENNVVNCYAENAFNQISDICNIYPLDIGSKLCKEIDNMDDLAVVTDKLTEIESRTVYMCFSTDILHSGHIKIIKKASHLGKIIVGVLSDEAVMSYKRFPIIPFVERKALFENLSCVSEVVEQKELSYKYNLQKYKPTYVAHGDDWRIGVQKPMRDEVVSCLAEYGGILVEYPYSDDDRYKELDKRTRTTLSLPDMRRARLKRAIEIKGMITALEAHSGITGLIVENSVVFDEGKARQFDAIWISSLCDSTAKGKPDIELVDMTSRFRTIDDIMEVTTKPIIFDGDTGGMTEHFVYTVKSLERMGVSMVIIEDKTGLKKNSLFGTDVEQTQASIESFCEKIKAGKHVQKTSDFMIVARIESLILEQGINDALTRAFAYVEAGADGIMIHSRKKEPSEIFEFVQKFREKNLDTPVVVVPTSFNTVTEEEFKAIGVNVVIYANHLTRTGFPAMQKAANTILQNHRAKECDDFCMSIKDIITLIPENE